MLEDDKKQRVRKLFLSLQAEIAANYQRRGFGTKTGQLKVAGKV